MAGNPTGGGDAMPGGRLRARLGVRERQSDIRVVIPSPALVGAIPAAFYVLLRVTGSEDFTTLFWLFGMCSLTACLLGLTRGIRSGQPGHLALWAGLLFWYAYPCLYSLALGLESVINPAWGLSDDDYMRAAGTLALFLATISLSPWAGGYRTANRLALRNGLWKVRLSRVVGLCLAITAAVLFAYVVSSGGVRSLISYVSQGRALEKPWGAGGNFGTASSGIFLVLSAFLTSSAALLLLCSRSLRLAWGARALCVFVSLLTLAFLYYESGTRLTVLFAVSPFLAATLRNVWNRSRSRFLIAAATTAVVASTLGQYQMMYRTALGREALSQERFLDQLSLFSPPENYFIEHIYATSLVPSQHDYFVESVSWLFVTSPIPRAIWQEKPSSRVVHFYALGRWGIDIDVVGGSVFPGIAGHYYMSYGWLGCVLSGVVVGLLASAIDFLYGRARSVRAVGDAPVIMLSVWLFSSFRNLAPGFLYPVGACYLIVRLAAQSHGKPGRLAGRQHVDNSADSNTTLARNPTEPQSHS